MAYTDLTLKKLFGLSGNECAFPGCALPVIDTEYGLPIGQICHIKSKSPGGPRYDESQTPEERDGYENLLVMCQPHNKVVDDELTRDQFPVEKLARMKKDHESRAPNTIVREDLAERIATIILALQLSKTPLSSIVPVIESYKTSSDNLGGIDYYCFRVSLRNEGAKTIRNFRLEVEIPNSYADPTHQSSMRGRCQVRGEVTVYLHTEEGHPGFVLHPNHTSDPLMNNNYIMRFDQYGDASGSIKVNVYYDDDLVGSIDYPIRPNRNKDRITQLGLEEAETEPTT